MRRIIDLLRNVMTFLLRHGRIWWLLGGLLLGMMIKILPTLMMILGMGAMGPAAMMSMPVAVEVALAQQGPMEDATTVAGSLEADEGTVIRSEVTGVVRALPLEEGSHVEQGTLLLSLDDATQTAALAQAKAQLRLAQSNYARLKSLREQDPALVAQRDFDTALSQLDVARASVQSTQAALDKTHISAPFSGTVGLRRVNIGDYVNVGQELVSLQSLDVLKVDFNLPERFAPSLQPGQPVNVTVDALGGKQVSATILAVDPLVSSGTRNVAVRARLDNPTGELRPGMFVRVATTLAQRENAISIPEEAIVPEGDAKYVFKVVNGIAQKTPVGLGMRSLGKVEVVSGIAAGDMVVTGGTIKVHEGSKVIPTNISAAGSSAEVSSTSVHATPAAASSPTGTTVGSPTITVPSPTTSSPSSPVSGLSPEGSFRA